MQDKKLDDMTKKYKEEMMRLYSKNRTANSAVPKNPAAAPRNAPQSADIPAAPKMQENPQQQRPIEQPARVSPRSLYGHTNAPVRDGNAMSEAELSHPPMPEIPKEFMREKPPAPSADAPKIPQNTRPSVKQAPAEAPAASKFPPAEEIMRQANALKAVPAMADASTAPRTLPEPRFEPAEEHNQGNYDFPPYPESGDASEEEMPDGEEINESYPDEDTDFSAVDSADKFPEDNPADMSGQGYLKVEVSTASRAVPVRDATVTITENVNGMSALIAMIVTDENGETPIIPLSAPARSFSEAPDPSERPYSEYNVGVYKQGFYTIPQLTVPIFDGVKSIQPISMIPLSEFELEGAVNPNENR